MIDPCSIFIAQDAAAIVIATLIFVMLLLVVILIRQEKMMSAQNQGLTDLTNEVAAETAEAKAEVTAFNSLATAVEQLVAAGPGEVTDAQLETFSQTLSAARAARQAAAAAATAVIPASPAPPAAS